MGQESEPPLPFPLESSPKHVWTTIRGDYKGNGDSSQWVRVDASRCVAASVVSGDCIAPLHHNQIELDADAIVESLPCDVSFPGGLSWSPQLSLTQETKGWTSLLPTQYEIERSEPPLTIIMVSLRSYMWLCDSNPSLL